MSHGRLSPAQVVALRPFVDGRTIHDLGAGQCTLAMLLLQRLGAACVIALDKESMPELVRAGLIQAQTTFEDVAGEHDVAEWKRPLVERARDLTRTIDVAFVSWPQNHPSEGLLRLLRRAGVVVYLGSNVNGSACAWPGLFMSEFLFREVLAHVPERANSLIVYGERCEAPRRKLLGEEIAAVLSYETSVGIMTFEEAQDASKRQRQ